MSISIDTYCLQCLLRRNIALAQTLGTEEQAMAFAKEIMKLCINAPEGVSSPWFGPQIADLLHEMYGLDYDRFRQEKLDSNHFVLERLPAIREKVTAAKDPVLAGLQFAILGNYLDFSALQGQVSFEKLEEMLDKALEMELDEQVYAYFCRDLRRGGKLCINAPEGVSSPWFGPQIADLLHEMYGLDYDRFRQEKLDSNHFVLERLPAIREKVTAAKDPVLAGLQFAILGNYLDFSALQGQVSFEKLEEMLDKALEMELDEQVYAYFCRDLRRGGKLVYLTDNAGEIGFDRVLAEAIAAAYPDISVTFCVRGAIAQNDATREDAAAVGIPFPVIDNGNRVAGTQLDMLSEEAAATLSGADVILAKGMANAETMLGCGYNVYYAFLVKCQRFVTRFGKPMFTPMLVKERE